MALTQSYFHPVDYVLSIPAVALPPLLCSSHVVTTVVWHFVFMSESINAHLGYVLVPGTGKNVRAHNFHHSHPHRPSEFGAMFGLMDWLFGTDQEIHKWMAERKAKEKKRKAK